MIRVIERGNSTSEYHSVYMGRSADDSSVWYSKHSIGICRRRDYLEWYNILSLLFY